MSVLPLRPAMRSAVGAVVAVLSLVTGVVVTMLPAGAAGPPPRVDLRVLVLTNGDDEASVIATELDSEGVPSTRVDLTSASRPTITDEYLSDVVAGVPRAKFQAVVLPNEAPETVTA